MVKMRGLRKVKDTIFLIFDICPRKKSIHAFIMRKSFLSLYGFLYENFYLLS